MLRLLRGGRESEAPPSPNPAVQPAPGRLERAEDPLRELATAAAAGSREAQRTLLVAVGPPLLRVVRGVLGGQHPDLEDTLQEAMVSLHLALVGFRGECTTLHFACRIGVQTALNTRRRNGYRTRHTPTTEPAALAELARDERSPAETIDAAACRETLRGLLAELPPPQAEVLALHILLGHTVDETAATLAVPRDTVRSRLRAALASLRRQLHAQPALLARLEEAR